MLVRIAATTAICKTYVEQAEIGVAGRRQRIEGQVTTVVVGEGLGKSDQLPRRSPIISSSAWCFSRPFEKNCVVCMASTVGLEVGCWRQVTRVRVRVKLAIAPAAALGELGMKRETLEPLLIALGLHAHAPVRRVDIKVLRDG